jgi:hypothetical protein
VSKDAYTISEHLPTETGFYPVPSMEQSRIEFIFHHHLLNATRQKIKEFFMEHHLSRLVQSKAGKAGTNNPSINPSHSIQPDANLELREVKQKLPKDCSKTFTYCM